jgi:hypothetical protein
LVFSDALQAGSCRPWVAIERRTVTIAAAAKLRYRFEVSPPAQTEPVECRFALMIESADASAGTGAANFPMSGRIAVIVYARVGAVKPELQIDETVTVQIDGRNVPALRVTNTGRATGRFVGFLNARDADGRFIDLAPDAIPVLPGMTRVIGLMPVPPLDRPNDPPPVINAWPITVKGTLEIGGELDAKRQVDATFRAR